MSEVEITLTVRTEQDRSVFTVNSDGVTVYASISGQPVVGLRDLDVNPAEVGEVVLSLLHDRTVDGQRDG